MLALPISPVRVPSGWVSAVGERLLEQAIPLVQVDSHNIVPCWIGATVLCYTNSHRPLTAYLLTASPKLEYSARTLRGKITKLVPEFLTARVDVLPGDPNDLSSCTPVDWTAAYAALEVGLSYLIL